MLCTPPPHRLLDVAVILDAFKVELPRLMFVKLDENLKVNAYLLFCNSE
jgi:hypothetical protein